MATSTVTRDQIEERLIDAITTMGPEREDVVRDATLEDLDIDSLDLVELSQIAEEEWNVELRSDDMKNIVTVGDALDLIVSRAVS
jgi:acyl carrier protein